MKLYFLRHAESIGNTNGQYNVSLAGNLTPRGEEQARELAARLAPLCFDEIIISPLERVALTILPYLKQTGREAEAWPELAEMRGRKDIPSDLPDEIRYGAPAQIPEYAARHMRFRSDSDSRLLPPEGESYVEGQRRARLACEKILTRYAGREVSVLMVGHACNGARVLEGLLRIEMLGRFQHENAGMTLMDQKANGEFIMLYQNRVTS